MGLRIGITVRFRKRHIAEQEAKFVVEVENTVEGEQREWKQLRSFTKRCCAESFLAGIQVGLKLHDTPDNQTATPTIVDEWPRA